MGCKKIKGAPQKRCKECHAPNRIERNLGALVHLVEEGAEGYRAIPAEGPQHARIAGHRQHAFATMQLISLMSLQNFVVAELKLISQIVANEQAKIMAALTCNHLAIGKSHDRLVVNLMSLPVYVESVR